MFCGLDLLLMAVGIWLMTVKSLSFGRMEVPSPRPLFMGLILLLQSPVGIASLFALGAAEGVIAAREGSTPDVPMRGINGNIKRTATRFRSTADAR